MELIKYFAPFFAILCVSASNSVMADDAANNSARKLNARIQKTDLQPRLLRPKTPEAPKKPASQTTPDNAYSGLGNFSFDPNKVNKDLAADLAKRVQKNNASKNKNESKTPSYSSIAAKEMEMQEGNGSGSIDWRNWHRNFVRNLYLRFHRANSGDYPGACRVLISVSNSGEIALEGGEDYQMQSDGFKSCLNRSLRMLAHSPQIEFPYGSRRNEVAFTMMIKSSKDEGSGSYGYDGNDFEKSQ